MNYVKADNLVISSSVGSGILLQSLKGIATPPIRTSSGDFSGRDGGWVSAQFYSGRPITIGGVIDSTCSTVSDIKCDFFDTFQIRTPIPLIIAVNNEDLYYTEGFVTDIRCDWNVDDFDMNIPFEVDLLCPDQNFYKVSPDDPSSAGWIEQTIYKIIGGGYITPYILPVEWEPSSTPTIVTNTSGTAIFPQIVLEGTFTSPRITNGRTGQYIEVGINVSGTLVIDLYNRTITLNGVSVLSSMSSGSSWWSILPGDNPISLTTSSGSDDTEGTIRYRIPYIALYAC